MSLQIKRIIKKNIKWIILLTCLIGFIAIVKEIFNKEIVNADVLAYNLIVQDLRNTYLTEAIKIITHFGGIIILTAIAIISLIILKNKKIGFCICINLAISTLLNLILKNLIQRPRPEGYMLINESGYSFPSGHSMVSMAFYGLIMYFIYVYMKNKKIKSILCTMISILILTIGISRIYLGVHYASDVLAGFLISISYLIAFIEIVPRLLNMKEVIKTKRKRKIYKKENYQ